MLFPKSDTLSTVRLVLAGEAPAHFLTLKITIFTEIGDLQQQTF